MYILYFILLLNIFLLCRIFKLPIPVALRCKAEFCSRLIAGLADLNPAEGIRLSSLAFFVCCVGYRLYGALIIRSEESYSVCVCVCVCLIVCDLETSKRRTRPDVGNCATGKNLQILVDVFFNCKDDGVSNGVGMVPDILQILAPPPL